MGEVEENEYFSKINKNDKYGDKFDPGL